jgi:flavin-dependent dehydrogenase
VNGLRLRDDDRVVVIGGGPAGALFAHYMLQGARQAGLRLAVTVFEGKALKRGAARGCNQSAGVVAHNFADGLRADGIGFPSSVVQRRIDGYLVETLSGSVRLAPPRQDEQIFTVFRGQVPPGERSADNIGFDDYLLRHVADEGASIVPHFVTSVSRQGGPGGPWSVTWREGGEVKQASAHLLAVATGARSLLIRTLPSLGFGYGLPHTTGSIQAEIALGQARVDSTLGNAIGVYLLNLPGVRFAALTPKAGYVTVTLIGGGADQPRLTEFLAHPLVRRRIGVTPERLELECTCHPEAVTGAARNPYTDRLVVVGDAAASRLYKNGLHSSLVTARAAATAAIAHGIGAEALARHYDPVCRAIENDNRWGHLLFEFSRLAVVRGGPLAQRVVASIAREQSRSAPGHRPVCELLWDTLSGTRPYAQIARHALRPELYAHLLEGEAGAA